MPILASNNMKKIFDTMLSESTSLDSSTGVTEPEKRSNLAKEVLNKVSRGVHNINIMNEHVDPVKFSNAIFDMFARTGFNLTEEQSNNAKLNDEDKLRIAASLQIAMEKPGLLHQHLGNVEYGEKIKQVNNIINTLAPDKEQLENYKNNLQQSLGIEAKKATAKPPLMRTDTEFQPMPVEPSKTETLTATAKPPLMRTDTEFQPMPVGSSTPKTVPERGHTARAAGSKQHHHSKHHPKPVNTSVFDVAKGTDNIVKERTYHSKQHPARLAYEKSKTSTLDSESRRKNVTPEQRELARKSRDTQQKQFEQEAKNIFNASNERPIFKK